MNLNNLKVQRYDGKLMDGKLMHLNDQLSLLNTRFDRITEQWVIKFVYIFPWGYEIFSIKANICRYV